MCGVRPFDAIAGTQQSRIAEEYFCYTNRCFDCDLSPYTATFSQVKIHLSVAQTALTRSALLHVSYTYLMCDQKRDTTQSLDDIFLIVPDVSKSNCRLLPNKKAERILLRILGQPDTPMRVGLIGSLSNCTGLRTSPASLRNSSTTHCLLAPPPKKAGKSFSGAKERLSVRST